MTIDHVRVIYAEHAAFVWRVLRGMGIADTQIEDAVQDVFVVVQRRYAEFDHRAKIRTWLFEIAYRIAQQHRRSRARTHTLVDLDEAVHASEPSPVQHLEQNESLRLVGQLLEMLDEEKRIVLVLADLEGMTAPEIAELLSVPLNTVYTRLRRARIQFNEALASRAGRET